MSLDSQWFINRDWIDLVEWDYPVGAKPRMHYPYWYGNPVPALPWNLRSDASVGKDAKWFTQSYPVLGPYYPVSSPSFAWLDSYASGPYHGYWWP